MAAWMIGGLGSVGVAWVGYQKFGVTLGTILYWIGLSNLCALIGGVLTLRLEKVSWCKRTLLRGSNRTWAFLLIFYFASLLLFAPGLRDLRILTSEIVPLLMSTGLMLNPFMGPIQDYLVRRAQREERLRAHLASE